MYVVTRPFFINDEKLGTAKVKMIMLIDMAISNSIKVNPFAECECLRLIVSYLCKTASVIALSVVQCSD